MSKPIYTYTHAEYAALEAENERLRAERDMLLEAVGNIGAVAEDGRRAYDREAKDTVLWKITQRVKAAHDAIAQYKAGKQ